MQITHLKLLGFKSFVEPTDLIIRPGLTGVVGPNGCGKSNLLEALRWVMGETSYKAMRGGAMDDVIFSGTQHRPARNHAEVTISIDNKERTAPAEFNHDDVLEIARTISRGEGSSYKVNGRDVRAKDVKLLFEDAATGARSHALVRQGQIGEIVNSKPQARRRILEDAAGIAGLHSRRHEAELRLNAAESNLERLADLMGQMDAQLNSLKRQARHALRYKEISKKLYAQQALLLHLLWKAAGEAVLKAETDLASILKLVDEETVNETSALLKREELQDALPPLREAEAKAAAALHRLTLANESLSREENQAKVREKELQETLVDAKTDLARDEGLIEDGLKITERLTNDITSLETETANLKLKKTDAQTQLDESKHALETCETEYNVLSQTRAETRAQRASLTNDIDQLTRRITNFTDEIGALLLRQKDLASLKAEQAGQHSEDALASEIGQIESSISEFEVKVVDAETNKSGLLDELQKTRTEENELALSCQALQTEIALLEKLLKPQAQDQKPLLDELKTESGYELALWAALGDDLDLPLEGHVRDTQNNSYWRSLSSLAAPHLPDDVPALAEFVQGPDLLIKRLGFVGVVSEAQAFALQKDLLPGHSLVSCSGGLWRWDGFIQSPHASASAPQRLTERNRLPLLAQELEDLETSLAQKKCLGQKVEQTLSDVDIELKSLRADLATQQKKLKDSQFTLRSLEQKTKEVDGQLASVEHRLELQGHEKETSEHRLSRQQKALEALPPQEQIDQKYDELKRQVELLRMAHSEAQLDWAGLEREEELSLKRIEEMKSERSDWEKRAKEAHSHIAELQTRIEKTSSELTSLVDLPQQFHEKRQALLTEISASETQRKTESDALTQAETHATAHEKELRELQKELMALREEKARNETRLEAARAQLLQHAEEIETKLNVKADACLELAGFEAAIELPSISETQTEVARLKKDRDRLGAVNLRAEDEIQELEEQFGSMISEREDLETAVAKLRSGVAHLNQEGRQRLLSAFDEVNAHFKRLFQTLFAGGEAELKLIDSDDPLEAGLEIIARPPGKRPQVLTLLSGGEKALTALSLIFAVFLTNPSPICVLDEVDAPLDDTNVDRFCLMMEEMARSTDTRFLVITHHPMTMERMDRLFGVTMSEKGVSQLVSVDLATAEGLLETA